MLDEASLLLLLPHAESTNRPDSAATVPISADARRLIGASFLSSMLKSADLLASGFIRFCPRFRRAVPHLFGVLDHGYPRSVASDCQTSWLQFCRTVILAHHPAGAASGTRSRAWYPSQGSAVRLTQECFVRRYDGIVK